MQYLPLPREVIENEIISYLPLEEIYLDSLREQDDIFLEEVQRRGDFNEVLEVLLKYDDPITLIEVGRIYPLIPLDIFDRADQYNAVMVGSILLESVIESFPDIDAFLEWIKQGETDRWVLFGDILLQNSEYLELLGGESLVDFFSWDLDVLGLYLREVIGNSSIFPAHILLTALGKHTTGEEATSKLIDLFQYPYISKLFREYRGNYSEGILKKITIFGERIGADVRDIHEIDGDIIRFFSKIYDILMLIQ